MVRKLSPNKEDSAYTSLKTKIILITLILTLNIVSRIPSIPHEKGNDSFFIHFLSNSLVNLGYANWWANWMSVLGLYPYSYASAVPFTLAGISQLTDIPMETTILLFCIFLGILSFFFAYLLAEMLFKNFVPRFVFSFLFSLSAGTLQYTTWEITSRGQFLIFFPLYIFLTIKLLDDWKKYSIMNFLILLFLFSTHHYVYAGILYSLLFLFTILANKNKLKIQFENFSKIIPSYNSLYVLLLATVLIIPFIFAKEIGFVSEGSKYELIILMIIVSIRNSGVVFPFAVSGFLYLVLKKEKNCIEWAILLCILPTCLFSYNITYGYIATYFFVIILGTIGIENIMKNYNSNIKLISIIIALILILNTSFSCFFSHWHIGIEGKDNWFMEDETYFTGEWIEKSISVNKVVMPTYYGMVNRRLSASSGGKSIMLADEVTNYVNNVIDLNDSDIIKNSIFSKSFYFDNPYVLKQGMSGRGLLNWIVEFPITDKRAQNFITEYNVSYLIESSQASTYFSRSLPNNRSRVYDSGELRLWTNS